MERLRVATYNVHKCRGLDGRTRPERIAEVLRQMDADVVALQEVLCVEGHPREDQAKFLAGELGLDYAIGENRRLKGGAYGNVILSRYPILQSANYDVSVPGRERRGCLRADIAWNGAVLHLFNVHLGTSYFERRQQARKLLDEQLLRSRELNGPRIVAGDFNEYLKGLVTQLLHTEFESADLRLYGGLKRSYPGVLPLVHLDHIYYDDDLILESVRVHRSLLALVASDHLPVVAEFAMAHASGTGAIW